MRSRALRHACLARQAAVRGQRCWSIRAAAPETRYELTSPTTISTTPQIGVTT